MKTKYNTIVYERDKLTILNQTLLPSVEEYETYSDYLDMIDAIEILKVRGAPLIGIMAAYGISVALHNHPTTSIDKLKQYYFKIRTAFSNTRPTAKNLFYALNKIDKVIEKDFESTQKLKRDVEKVAISIHNSDKKACIDMAKNGYEKIFYNKDSYNFITHCNTGSLATGGIGTALGIIKYLHHNGKKVHVYVDETRPLLQGSRLTAWELRKEKIPYTIVTDGMSAQIMKNNKIDAVIVGADRVAANGDSANKIGTFNLAIVAKHFNVPFFIAAPFSTFDLTLKTGDDIPIEIRSDEEITTFLTNDIAPFNSKAINYAFDVTPANLIKAIITEKGVLKTPLK